MKGMLIAGTMAAALIPQAAVAQLAQKPALTLEASRRIVAEAEAHASANGWNVVIAIVDDGGHAILLQRMDGTQTGSIEVALDKARSAAAFLRSTLVFSEAVAGGALALLRLRGAVPIEGGLPLIVDGHVIGAIGVSGVTAAQDGQIAQAGALAVARLTRD
jgi:glc operon protein GlcG